MENSTTLFDYEVKVIKRNTQFVDEFSREVWEQTYQYHTDQDVNDTHFRVAKGLASVEAKEVQDYWTSRFLDILEDFCFVPGGRITSNAGTGLKGTTLINCFVSAPGGEYQDSMEGILRELRHQALILKSEGGYGFCADFMRPRGSFIYAIANESPGAVRMLDMWDTQSAVITSGSGKKKQNEKGKNKIRKGAQMVTMSCWHPDIEEFVTAKQEPGRLTKFNMSVLATDEFMEAVKNHLPWRLEFPNYEATEEIKIEYNKMWSGNIKAWKEKGLPVKVYKEYEDANELWDLIMESTYNRGEPGILFTDTINRLNNLYYHEYINSCNPCLAGDTLVATDRGLLRFDNLVHRVQGGEHICCLSNNVTSGKTWKIDAATIQRAFCSGTKDVVVIALSNGQELTATPDHKIWTTQGYVPAAQLEGHEVQLNEVYAFGERWDLPFEVRTSFVGKNKREYTTKLPKEWTPELGFVLGWATGDGWLTDNSVGLIFGKNDSDVLQKIKNIYRQWGLHYSEVVDDHNSTTLYVGSKLFYDLMKQCGLQRIKAKDKNVPSSIFEAPKPVVAAFLNALFSADGSILSMKRGNYWIALTSSSKCLVQEVQQLLMLFGITHQSIYHVNKTSTFKYTTTDGERKEYIGNDYYDLRIFGKGIPIFSEQIGFGLQYKHEKLAQIVDKRFKKKSSVVKVVSVQPAGKQKVYDLTEPVNHSFVAQGITVSNCGEQQLPAGGVCLLGSLNLTQFIDYENQTWDWDKLTKVIPIIVRFMDNVNDKTKVPLPIQEVNLHDKRRIGLGVLGYGSALMMLKVRYGSNEAITLTEELMTFIMNKAYQASALLAAEKGIFPLYDEEAYLSGEFTKRLSSETIEMIHKYGLRNSHLLSIQPTGNSSVLANNVSGGLEPVFKPKYIRTSVQSYPPDGLKVPKNINWTSKSFDGNGKVWEWTNEGDEDILITTFENIVYKIDRNRGLTKETEVLDYGIRYLTEKDEWDSDAKWATSAMELSVDEHINTMEVFSKYIDSAVSKTLNIPSDYPYEDFKQVYTKAHKTGTIKGCTTYREGTMTTVLAAKSIAKAQQGIQRNDSPPRPESLSCNVHHMTYKGDKWISIVGLYGDDPYEVFAFKQNGVILPKTVKKGTLTKRMQRNRGKYDLECDNGLVIKDVTSHFDQDEEETVTRCISMALRHGVDIEYIVDQLLKSHGTITSFNKIIARALKKYLNGTFKTMKCLDCGSKNIRMQESCFVCCDCGMSKCS